MWKALLFASGLTLAAATAQATPIHAFGDALRTTASTIQHDAIQPVRYDGYRRHYRHDRGHHYGWYKPHRRYGYGRSYYRDPYRHRGYYRPYRYGW